MYDVFHNLSWALACNLKGISSNVEHLSLSGDVELQVVLHANLLSCKLTLLLKHECCMLKHGEHLMYSKFISAIECLKKTVKLGFLHYWHDIYVHTGFLVLKT